MKLIDYVLLCTNKQRKHILVKCPVKLVKYVHIFILQTKNIGFGILNQKI